MIFATPLDVKHLILNRQKFNAFGPALVFPNVSSG